MKYIELCLPMLNQHSFGLLVYALLLTLKDCLLVMSFICWIYTFKLMYVKRIASKAASAWYSHGYILSRLCSTQLWGQKLRSITTVNQVPLFQQHLTDSKSTASKSQARSGWQERNLSIPFLQTAGRDFGLFHFKTKQEASRDSQPVTIIIPLITT